jgi:site-specific recombinase XerD
MTTAVPTLQLRPHTPTCLTCRTPKNGKQQALSQNQVQITTGTELAASGIDLLVLRELMGHANPETTAAYVHLAPETLAAEYARARAGQR